MTGDTLPKARIRRRRLFRVVWVVPAIALGVAGWLMWQHLSSIGPEIAITFDEAAAMRVGQTPVRYRGVQVGEVVGIGLSEDLEEARVSVRLVKSASALATEGTVFWIVRPQLEWGNVTGLSTVLSGPEIHALPGQGKEAKLEFAGLDNAPIGLENGGLRLVLRTGRPKGIKLHTPVLYRGVEVGLVHKLDLAPNATSVDVHITIRPRYAHLVRTGTAFWNTSGLSVHGGILKGLDVEIESLRALVTGSIEFATPPGQARVKAGTVFALHDKPRAQWLDWAPKLSTDTKG